MSALSLSLSTSLSLSLSLSYIYIYTYIQIHNGLIYTWGNTMTSEEGFESWDVKRQTKSGN
jgi:hypothetical protein